jgi:dipeptidyl-peptidase-4
MRTRLCGLVFSFLLGCSVLAAMPQAQEPSAHLATTFDRIFNQHEFTGKRFGPARWIENGAAYTTLESSPDFPASDATDIVRYETATGERTVLVAAARLVPAPGSKPLAIENYAWSRDNHKLLVFTNSRKVWRQNTRGDYWVLDLRTAALRKLGGEAPESSLMFAKFSPDGASVAWVRDNNLYLETLSSGSIRALTSDGNAMRINGTSDWVNEEELDIRDGFRFSPDGKSIAYWQFDTTGVGSFTLVNDTAETYPTLKQFPYPVTGTQNSSVRIGVVSTNGGATRWMDLQGDPHDFYIARMAWTENSQELVLEKLNRLQNTNEVILADAQSGTTHRFFQDTDSAWVDVVDSLDWIKEGKGLLWLSERDGWRHAYEVDRSDGKPRLITSGPHDVIEELTVDSEQNWFYYIASPENATERYLYRVPLDGKSAPERLTPKEEPGSHRYDISPDGAWAFHTYSTFDHPPVTELVRLPSHERVRTLESNEELARKVQDIVPSPAEFFTVTLSGGAKLDGWMMKPPGFDPQKKYPVLVYVYGEPADVTVTNSWSGTRGLFHRAIASEGYLVVSIDNQGTPAPKGRAWRKMIYGSVGVLSSAQQAEAIGQLAKERSYIDSSRMAVWGWSGGGSNTLNLMFRSPGLFTAGMAVAPIADQRYYDTIYQERYMGLPQTNASGYHDGSPISFAAGLTGKLLIVHGSGDDNCHYQVTELLVNRLIALGKPFEFMDYPNRTHSISESAGTSFHIYSLLARYLEEHVAPGGLSQ